MKTPLDILLPYQRDWFDDQARFKIGCWSRQTGKSFATAAEAVADCKVHKTQYVCLSAGERQALEWMRKAQEWTQAFELAEDYAELREGSDEALLKSAEIQYPHNGSRIIALPANPNTARGYSANLILDEFAFHEHPDKIWRAIYPSISNPLRGQYKLRIVSTPNGKANKFYDLWTKNAKVRGRAVNPAQASYSGHLIDIHTAVERGLPVDVEELKRGLDDPEGWEQEFLCQFLDEASILLPYDLIATCESDDAIDHWPHLLNKEDTCYLGIDIGRKRDLTVGWLLVKRGDVLWTAGLKVFEKTPFHIQLAFFEQVSRASCIKRVCVDASGIGAMLAEELHRKVGGKVEECAINAPFKQEIMEDLRRSFQDRTVRIPISRAIREDLHSLQKKTTNAGNVRYLAPHSEDGHADRATALALALHAGKQAVGPAYAAPITLNRSSRRDW